METHKTAESDFNKCGVQRKATLLFTIGMIKGIETNNDLYISLVHLR